jgi:hypothetical protein
LGEGGRKGKGLMEKISRKGKMCKGGEYFRTRKMGKNCTKF